jgi:hypothetical protein
MSRVFDDTIVYDRGEVIYLILESVQYYSGDYIIATFLDKELAERWLTKYNQDLSHAPGYLATHFITTAQPKDFPE